MAGRRRTRVPLVVFINGRRVGELRRDAGGAVDFRYDPEWLGWEGTFPVSLSLPLREDRYVGAPVVAVFENLLPDNEEIRRRLAARMRAEGIDAFSLLAAIGRDCVGALQFIPADEPAPALSAIAGAPLADAQIANLLANLGTAPLGVDPERSFRISLAGAQEKTALLWWKGKWHRPLGTTPTTHILKPPIGRLPNGLDLSASVENEFLCMKLAAAAGLPAADVSIARFGGIRALVIARFDRRAARGGRLLRLPQEDCCQALAVPPARRYQADGGPGVAEILALLKASDDPTRDQHIFLKAQVFFWLLGATDGHAKNFSLHLLPGGRFRLAPLYDILSMQPLVVDGALRHRQFRVAMAVGEQRHYAMGEIQPRHFVQTARAAGIGSARVDEVFADLALATPSAVAAVHRALPRGFPASLFEQVAKGVGQRLRAIGGRL